MKHDFSCRGARPGALSQITMIRRYPSEWEKQKAVWLSWPHNEKEWGRGRLGELEKFYISLISTILRFQDVNLIFPNVETCHGMSLQNEKHKLKKIIIPNNDIWIRDYGPFFAEHRSVIARRHKVPTKQPPNVIRDEIASVAMLPRNDVFILDFQFNAWGEKFPPYDLDNNVPKEIATYLGMEIESYPMILEGGALDFNGDGIVLTTEECILNKNRNKNLTKEKAENLIKSAFNINEIIWLKRGLIGDHTDGHIDNVARFIGKDKILISCANKDNENYEHLQRSKKLLEERFEVIDIPLPEVKDKKGNNLPASYINFIFVNGGIIVPTFKSKTDDGALEIFHKLFPDRIIIGFDCSLLIEEGGGLHCMSKQE